MTTNTELQVELTKALPAATVSGLTLFGVGLADWVLIMTLGYTVLQIFFLLRDKLYRPFCLKRMLAEEQTEGDRNGSN